MGYFRSQNLNFQRSPLYSSYPSTLARLGEKGRRSLNKYSNENTQEGKKKHKKIMKREKNNMKEKFSVNFPKYAPVIKK